MDAIGDSRRFSAVIFDLDGVLVDTRDIWVEGECLVAGALGLGTPPAHELGLSVGQVAAHLVGKDSSPERVAVASQGLIDWLVADGWKSATPLPGARELVAALIRSGLRVGVASNAPTAFARLALGRAGFEPARLVVVGVDDDECAPKPEPDVYNQTRLALGAAASETAAVEDSRIGVQAARDAGVFVIGVSSSEGDGLSADYEAESLADVGVWDILGLRDRPSAESLTTIYVETAKVAQAFFDWRNKLMRFTFTAVGVVFAVAGWLWIHRHSGLLASLPLFGGAMISLGCIYLERRNHEILAQCYAVNREVESRWGARPLMFPEAPPTRRKRVVRWLLLPIPGTPVPSAVQSTGGIFTNLALGRRSYFRVLRLMFVLATLLQLVGAIYFLHSAHMR